MKTKAAAMQLQKRQTTDGRQPRGAAEARPSLEASAQAWHADSCFMPLAPEHEGVRFHHFKPPSLCPDSAATVRSRAHFPGGQSPFPQALMSEGTPGPSGGSHTRIPTAQLADGQIPLLVSPSWELLHMGSRVLPSTFPLHQSHFFIHYM